MISRRAANKRIPGLMPLVLLLSCSRKSEPERVAEQYLTAFMNRDWDEAMKYGNNCTRQGLQMLKESGDTGFGRITEIKNVECRVEKEEAYCTFCCMDTALGNLRLRKSPDGKWEVTSNKDFCNPENFEKPQKRKHKH